MTAHGSVWRSLSLGVCLDLLRLRLRLPRLVEREALDVLLDRLARFTPTQRSRTRAKLDASIKAAEALVTRLGLAPDTCLYRSMARYALLRSHGVPAYFCMGVPPSPGGAHGHAWVEDEEGPYGERIEQDAYVVTFCHPQSTYEPCIGATGW